MPIYEEKLISPLAVRFTQQRIRTTFRDGREVEATIKELTTMPGTGDYDLIIVAPFPAIEIVRWSPHGRGSGGKDHWFSFDNRRLYCLQRIAAEYWPKRVGAVVEVLYADSGAIRKKLDSKTCGLSVSIGHAFAAEDELKEWDWHKNVQGRSPPGMNITRQAEAGVLTDDAKARVSDLPSMPTASMASRQLLPSSLEKSSSDSEVEACDNIKNQDTFVAALPADNSLSSLIGQLLNLEAKDTESMAKVGGVPEGEPLSCADASVPRDLSVSDSIGQPVNPKTALSALGDGSSVCSTPQVQDGSSLAGLIGQLLDLETKGSESEARILDTPIGQLVCAAEESKHEDSSLTGLIGQLLDLNSKEHLQLHEHASACSTCSPDFSASSQSGDSNFVTLDSPMLAPSFPAADLVPVDDEDEVQQQQSSATHPSRQHHPKKEAPVIKAKRKGEAVPNARDQMAQRQKDYFAQRQNAHWQMMQLQAARMAQLRHASQAYQVAQARQFWAAQAAQW